MSSSRLVSWAMLCVWASWVGGLQAIAAESLGAWVPDALTILLLSLTAELDDRDVPKACVVLAFARLAFTVEPAEATLCGFLTLGAFALGVRSVAEASGALVRTLWGGTAVLLFSGWLIFVHAARSDFALELDWTRALPTAASSAVFALCCGPLLRRLPGLSPLWRPRW